MATNREPKNKKNRVCINSIWYWRFTYDGKQFLGHTREEAQSKLQAYKNSNKLSRDRSFGDLVDWWIDAVYSKDSSIRDSTRALHLNAFYNVFEDCKLLNERIDSITGTDIQKVFSSSAVSGSTQRHCRSLLRRFYKYLLANGLVLTDATQTILVAEVEHRRKTQEIETFSEEELKSFINDTPENHRLKLLIVLAIFTGARVGELLALTYQDIENGKMIIDKSLKEIQPIRGSNNKTRLVVDGTKTASSVRTLPIDNEIIKEAISHHKKWHLNEMLKENYRTQNVFTTSSGNLLYPSSVRTAFTRLRKDLGITHGHFHTFRDTFATRLVSNGVPIETVSKILGHTDISVTSKYYVNISHDSMREAMEKMAL